MNKIEFSINEYGDFGPIKIGMSKTEINTILGDVFTRKNVPYTGMVRDIYGRKNIIIDYFDQNGINQAAYIEVSYPIKVIYLNKDLMRMSISSIKSLLENDGLKIEKMEVRPQIWCNVCLSKGFGLNSTAENSNHLFSVYMFHSDYYNKTEKLWQEHKKSLSQRTENLFREFGITIPPQT